LIANRQILTVMTDSWCLVSIDGHQIKAKIIHKSRGKFKIVEDEEGGKYVGRIVDASEVLHCKF